MTIAVQRLIDALSVGSTYALLALGLTLVYSVMNLVNFAYGMMLVWTASIAVLLTRLNVPVAAVIVLSIAFTTILSVVIGATAFRPFLTAAPVILLITSFGVELITQYGAILVFGEQPRILQVPQFFNAVTHFGDLRIPNIEMVTIVTSIVVMGSVYLLLRRTQFGIEIRATAEKPGIATLMGMNPNRVLFVVFAISGIVAGIVGLLWFAKVGAVSPRSDLDPTFKAFVAIVLGGLGNIRGAVVGGLTLGAIEVFLSAVLPDVVLGYVDAIVFSCVIGILILRPGGLLGTVTDR